MWRPLLLIVVFGIIALIPTLGLAYLFHIWEWRVIPPGVVCLPFSVPAVYFGIKLGTWWEDRSK